jgi:hypothetical protein
MKVHSISEGGSAIGGHTLLEPTRRRVLRFTAAETVALQRAADILASARAYVDPYENEAYGRVQDGPAVDLHRAESAILEVLNYGGQLDVDDWQP